MKTTYLNLVKILIACAVVALECWGGLHLSTNATVLLGMVLGALGVQGIVTGAVSAYNAPAPGGLAAKIENAVESIAGALVANLQPAAPPAAASLPEVKP
jgi:hypothetical protein